SLGDGRPSFLIQPVDEELGQVRLCRGEMLLFFAGSNVHALEPVRAGERVSMLWMLFQPVDALRRVAPFVPTPSQVGRRVLTMAEVSATDVVYDLGCGDGRLVILAAKRFGARAVGLERDPGLVRAARARVRAAGLEGQVRIEQQDALRADVREATVVTLFLNA